MGVCGTHTEREREGGRVGGRGRSKLKVLPSIKLLYHIARSTSCTHFSRLKPSFSLSLSPASPLLSLSRFPLSIGDALTLYSHASNVGIVVVVATTTSARERNRRRRRRWRRRRRRRRRRKDYARTQPQPHLSSSSFSFSLSLRSLLLSDGWAFAACALLRLRLRLLHPSNEALCLLFLFHPRFFCFFFLLDRH